MLIDLKAARHVLACVEALVAEKLPLEHRVSECPECCEEIDIFNTEHLIWGERDDVVIIIGCEGYWAIDPALVGIDSPNWQPAGQYLSDELNDPDA